MTNLYTYQEAAEKYNLPEKSIRNAVSTGVLKVIDFGGGHVRLREQDLDAWLGILSGAS
jgi:excisionase family DNA binding protein